MIMPVTIMRETGMVYQEDCYTLDRVKVLIQSLKGTDRLCLKEGDYDILYKMGVLPERKEDDG